MTQEVKMKATFPSVEWFNAIQELINNSEGYKHIGTCDATVGIKLPDLGKYYRLTFEAFELSDAREASEVEAENTDFWLEMPYARWKEMLENIKANGKADLHHTLNTIDIEIPEGFARSNDGYRRDAFYRFNQSFQYLFDAWPRSDDSF